jgi:anti-anti-sigma factor
MGKSHASHGSRGTGWPARHRPRHRPRRHRPRRGGGYPQPGGHTIVTLRDDLDFATAPVLRERLIDVLHRGIDLLILDLSHVPSCDAGGLAVLVATQRRAGLLGITMRLVAPSLPVSKVLDSTGLRRHFAICAELSGALATERPKPAGLASASAIRPAAVGGGGVAAVRTVGLPAEADGYRSLQDNQRVEYTPVRGDKGPQATNVRPL